MKISKKEAEEMGRKAGLKPVSRQELKGFDLLISDGFSLPPHKSFRRFGVDADDFPSGCYVTMWWLMKGEDHMFVGHALMFDVFHDPEYDRDSKVKMRINSAVSDANNFLKRLESHGTEHRMVH